MAAKKNGNFWNSYGMGYRLFPPVNRNIIIHLAFNYTPVQTNNGLFQSITLKSKN